ncbi:MAG: type II toxin-antitoxin system VapC family toxin [Streptosporangiaceae bacterium]
MIYLDSAAVVKLVHAEAESQALRAWLGDRSSLGWVSSVLVEVETVRALARHAPDAISRLPPVLDLMVLVEISSQVRAAAQTVMPPAVRTLDAIHLATALHMSDQLTSFLTYDLRLAGAAIAAGLTVDSPAK